MTLTNHCERCETPLDFWENHGINKTYCKVCKEIWSRNNNNEKIVQNSVVFVPGMLKKIDNIYWAEMNEKNFHDLFPEMELYKIPNIRRDIVYLPDKKSLDPGSFDESNLSFKIVNVDSNRNLEEYGEVRIFFIDHQ